MGILVKKAQIADIQLEKMIQDPKFVRQDIYRAIRHTQCNLGIRSENPTDRRVYMPDFEDLPWKVPIMGYLLQERGAFQADIATILHTTQAIIHDPIHSLSDPGYIVLIEKPPVPAVGKTVYWHIAESPSVLLKLYTDPDFKYLQDHIRSKPWIHEIVMKKFDGYPDGVLQALPKMLGRSPSFFEVLLKHETLDQLKDYYHPYLKVNQFLTGFDETFVGCWILYQLFVECCIKDRNAPLIAESPEGKAADELFEVLMRISPISRQSEDIKHLQMAVHAIELTFPYWSNDHGTIKESIRRNISEFQLRCAEAKRQPLEERDHAIYYATFLNILHDLAMDQHGDPLDPL